jgi:hypothetical protein
MKKGETLISGLTVKSITIGTALVIFWALYYVIVTGFSKTVMAQLPSILVTFFMLTMIGRVMPKARLNPHELTVVYSMIASTMGMALWWTAPNLYSSLYHLTQSPNAAVAPKYQPTFWCPTDISVLTPAYTGNAPVPWGEWTIPMLWWFSFSLMLILYTHFFALIMRKQFVDIEKLPFPIASAAHILMETEDEKSTSFNSKLRIALVGIVLGLIIPGFFGPFHTFLPTIPSLSDELNLNPYLIETLPNALLGASFFGGLTVAVLFLWPTDLLLSSFVFYVTFGIIIPVVQVKMGILPYIPGQVPLMYYYINVVPGLGGIFVPAEQASKAVQIATITHIGAPMGIAVFSLLLAKDHIIKTIKAIKNPEIEDEPYRIYWIGLIASFLGFLGLLVLCEMPILFAILSLIVFQFYNLLNIRIRGEAGYVGNASLNYGPGFGAYHYAPAAYTMVYFPVTQEARSTRAFWVSEMFHGWSLTGSLTGSATPTPSVRGMESFKLASLTKTDIKGMIVTQIFASCLAIAIGIIVSLWGAYTFGLSARWPSRFMPDMSNWVVDGIDSDCTATTFSMYIFGPPPRLPEFLAGFILTGVLTFLRLRFVWFPLHPLGVVLSFTDLTFSWCLFYGIVWVLKMLVLKIGSAKLYEEKAVPLCLGYIVGWAILWFITLAYSAYLGATV